MGVHHCFLHLADLQVPVLLVEPADAFLDVVLNLPVLDVFEVAVLLAVAIDGLVAVGHFLLQLLVLQPSVVELGC